MEPLILSNEVTLYEGDCIDVMRKYVESDSVDLTVTSPPYDNLRNYNGFSFDFPSVSNELYRITKPGGVVVWIVGDATVSGSETGTSFRQALGFIDAGFKLHDTMIYCKRNAPPQFKSKRYTNCFEYMFVLSKGAPSVCNYITEPCTQAGKKRSATGIRQADGTMYLSQGANSKPVRDTKVKGNIWSYLTGKGHSTLDAVAFQHPAIYPDSLAEDHILSWANEGDVVFDPFLGSGTTGKMSVLNRRRFVGCELSHDYLVNIAKPRIEDALRQRDA